MMFKRRVREFSSAIAFLCHYLGRTLSLALLCVTTALITPGISQSRSMPSSLTIAPVSVHRTQQVAQTASAPTVLEQAATQQYESGNFDAAANLWQQLVREFRQRGDRAGEALAFSNLALSYQKSGQWEQASAAIAASLALLQASSQQTPSEALVYAQTLEVKGQISFEQGQFESALNHWEQAATLYLQLNQKSKLTQNLIYQAQVLQSMGRYQQAHQRLLKVQDQIQSEPVSLVTAIAFRSLGNQWRNTGNLDQSQQILQQSLAIAQTLKNPQAISETYLSLGNTVRAQGVQSVALDNRDQAEPAFQKALNYYAQAAAMAPSPLLRVQAQLNRLSLLGDRCQLKASGESHSNSNSTKKGGDWCQLQEALALQSQLHPYLKSLPVSRSTVYAQINYARTMLKLSQQNQPNPSTLLNDAKQVLQVALNQIQALGDRRTESFVQGTLGQVYQAQGQFNHAFAFTQQALLLAEQGQAEDSAYHWYWQLGQLFWRQGKREVAIAAYHNALQILQALRADLVAMNPDVQYSFREDVEPVYREFVELLLQPTAPNPADISQARSVIELLQLAEVENFLRQTCVVPSQSIDAVVDQQDSTAAVIYPIILEDRLDLIVKLPNQVLHYQRSPVNRVTLELLLNQLGKEIRRRDLGRDFEESASQLYDWLIGPIESYLNPNTIKTLVFVLDGPLRNIPMAVLYHKTPGSDRGKYLIEDYAIALTPGLNLLEPKRLASQALYALIAGLTLPRQFAINQHTFEFGPLPNVKTEVQEIGAALHHRADILLDQLPGQEFTTDHFRDRIQSSAYSIVHLATHGQFSSNPQETFIVTASGEPINVNELQTVLRTRQDRTLDPIALLVLSACQTATGDNRAALGMAGVAVRSGASSTLASLWSVNDQSTALLMQYFYEILGNTAQKMSTAEAVRLAQLRLLQLSADETYSKYYHPYYWAPFVLIGNWL